MRIVNDLDNKSWLNFVENNSAGNIFHTPYMMEIFKNTRDYKPLLVAAIDADTNDILSLTILVQITLYGGFLAKFTSRAVSYGGFLYDDSPAGRDSLKYFIEDYDKKYKKQMLFTEIRNINNTDLIREPLGQAGFKFSDFVNYLIDLKRPKDEIFNSFSKSLRRNIRKSSKNGFTVERVKDISQISVLYKLLDKSYSRGKVPLADISLFESAFEELYHRNLLNVFLLKYKNKYIAGRVILLSKNTFSTGMQDQIRNIISCIQMST